LKFRREAEETLRKQVEELKTVGAAKDDRIGHLEAAIAKYEAAVQARTQAETFVSELRSNYERQLAVAEKQLAIEQGKTNFWRTMAKVGLFTGVLVGAVAGYSIASK
jgi:flagellar biosynthesis chaperone FliJ